MTTCVCVLLAGTGEGEGLVNGGNVLCATDENISASACVICAVGCGCVSVEVKWRTWQTKVSKWQCEKNNTDTVAL